MISPNRKALPPSKADRSLRWRLMKFSFGQIVPALLPLAHDAHTGMFHAQ